MTLLGREVPELPAEVLFSDLEIEVLKAYAKIKNFTPPKNLGDAVKVVARIGGYLDRKKDPPPGHQLMWQEHQNFFKPFFDPIFRQHPSMPIFTGFFEGHEPG